MIPPRPIGGSFKANFLRDAYDSIVSNGPAHSDGFLTSRTTRGTFRTPMVEIISRPRIDDIFQLIHTVPWAGSTAIIQETDLPTLVHNGLWVGRTRGEQPLPAVEGLVTSPGDQHILNGAGQSWYPPIQVRTKLFQKRTGTIRFTLTTTPPIDHSLFPPFSKPTRLGMAISLYYIPSLPTEAPEDVVVETQIIDGNEVFVEKLTGETRADRFVYAVFRGKYSGAVGSLGENPIKPRGGELPTGIFPYGHPGGGSDNVAIHDEDVTDRNRIWNVASFDEAFVPNWVPSTVFGYTAVGPNSGLSPAIGAHGPLPTLGMLTNQSEYEVEIDIGDKINSGQLFYFVINYGLKPEPQWIDPPFFTTLNLTIRNL